VIYQKIWKISARYFKLSSILGIKKIERYIFQLFRALKWTGRYICQLFRVLKVTGHFIVQLFRALKVTGCYICQLFRVLKVTGHYIVQLFRALKVTGCYIVKLLRALKVTGQLHFSASWSVKNNVRFLSRVLCPIMIIYYLIVSYHKFIICYLVP